MSSARPSRAGVSGHVTVASKTFTTILVAKVFFVIGSTNRAMGDSGMPVSVNDPLSDRGQSDRSDREWNDRNDRGQSDRSDRQ